MGSWLLSRRDRLIVARHEVPGLRRRENPVPQGWSKSLSVPEKDPFYPPEALLKLALMRERPRSKR
jgi:hypothetical protein